MSPTCDDAGHSADRAHSQADSPSGALPGASRCDTIVRVITLMRLGTPPIHITVSASTDWPTTIVAVLGLVLAILSLGWQFYTWHGSGSRVQVEMSFRIFPGLVRSQMMDQLAQAGLPPELTNVAQQALRQQALIELPPDLGYPVAAELMAVLPPKSIMIVASIRNFARLPVTIQ
jgi:hypothetical protein